MLQVDLTTLSPPELKRLLNTTRERGQASLSYQILQEMAARRERGPAALFGGRRPAEPRVIAVDLDDPLEPSETAEAGEEDDIPPLPPGWVPQRPQLNTDAEPAAESPPSPRRRRKASPPAPDAARPEPLVITERPRPERAPQPEAASSPKPDVFAGAFAPTVSEPPPRFSRWSGLIFAAGVSLGVASGWWAGGVTHELLRQDTSPKLAASAPAPRATAVAAAPAPIPAAAPAEAPATSAATVADLDIAPSPAPAVVAQPVRAAAKPCAAAPTRADRTICEHPRLQALQRDLRHAYAEALQVHQDRALLRQRQLAWREARNEVAAPGRLARLYDDRIRQLHAAAADARRRARRA